MAENTKIEWCDHTFNPWIGCTKVSAGCANCYAETLMDKRLKQVHWGKGQPRKRTSEKNWKLVEQWNLRAKANRIVNGTGGAGHRPRVFCASLADIFDPEAPVEYLVAAFDLIRCCPHLDFLLLSKRLELWPDRIKKCVAIMQGGWMENTRDWLRLWAAGSPPRNVWIGTSVEDGPNKKRIDDLRNIPAKVRFLSCEPLLADLGYIDLRNGIDWVICGGESGPKARPMYPDWARSLRDQCVDAGVAFFMKQMGGMRKPFPEIPSDLMIRQFPEKQPL